MKETIGTRWPNVKFLQQVMIVLTVPAGFSDQAKAVMRQCIYEAELIKEKNSEKLQFTTEREFISMLTSLSNLIYKLIN
jgi:hypothetical protein